MEWLIIVVLCLVLIPVVYRILRGAVNFLAKLVLVLVSVVIVGYLIYYLIQ